MATAPSPRRRPSRGSAARRRPPPPRAARRRREPETAARVLAAIPWIAFAIAIVVTGELVFAAAMIGFGLVALHELFALTARARPVVPAAFVSLAALVLVAHYGEAYHLVLTAAASFPVLFLFAALRPERRGVAYSMAVTVFGVAWVAIPLTHAVLLRDLDPHGAGLLVDVLIATFLGDTAAYTGGRMFGRHRIAPVISPNKTLEGLLFGLVGGTAALWFAGLYQDWLSGADALVMGACVAATAPIGDLFESMVKRDLGVKDTGRLFGPHGGVLDRLDAVFFTVVAGYYLAVGLL